MEQEAAVNWSSWGGWVVNGLIFLATVILANIIRPIRDKGIKNEQDIEGLKMKQVEQETTLKMYVEHQSGIQRVLGRIEAKLGEAVGELNAQGKAITRLETEMSELRTIHLEKTA